MSKPVEKVSFRTKMEAMEAVWALSAEEASWQAKVLFSALMHLVSRETGLCSAYDATLAVKLGTSERTISRASAKLKRLGLCTKRKTRGAPVYAFDFQLITKTRQQVADHTDKTRQQVASDTRQPVSDDPPLRGESNNQSFPVNEPKKDAGAFLSPRSELEKVIDSERALAIIEMRQAKKNPLTAHQARLLADVLDGCPDAAYAADKMIMGGWSSIDPEWFKQKPLRAGGTVIEEYDDEIPY
jgi:hypothetical protein